MFLSNLAAKLGRRSRKMREMINEATRTIEDSQTAQALHGLLSLKSDANTSGHSTPLKSIAQPSIAKKAVTTDVTSALTSPHMASLTSDVPPAVTTVVVGNEPSIKNAMTLGGLPALAEPIPSLTDKVSTPATPKTIMELLASMKGGITTKGLDTNSPLGAAQIQTQMLNALNSNFTTQKQDPIVIQPLPTQQTVKLNQQALSNPVGVQTIVIPSTPTSKQTDAQVLSQLIQAQVGNQAIQIRPTMLNTSESNNSIVQSAPISSPQIIMPNQQKPVSIQLISSASSVVHQPQFIQTNAKGEVVLPAGTFTVDTRSSPGIMPQQLVLTSPNAATHDFATESTKFIKMEEQVRSPLKKRPYALGGDVNTPILDKRQKLEPEKQVAVVVQSAQGGTLPQTVFLHSGLGPISPVVVRSMNTPVVATPEKSLPVTLPQTPTTPSIKTILTQQPLGQALAEVVNVGYLEAFQPINDVLVRSATGSRPLEDKDLQAQVCQHKGFQTLVQSIISILAHPWGAYAIPLALAVIHRQSSILCRLCPP